MYNMYMQYTILWMWRMWHRGRGMAPRKIWLDNG